VEKHNILLVDDSDDDALFVEDAVGRCADVPLLHSVHNGYEAIDYLDGKPPFTDRAEFPLPDLILLDLKMPGMDGFDFLGWLEARHKKHPFVIVLSGSGFEADREKSLKLGACEYHTKKADHRETIKMVTGICERLLK